MLVKNTLRFQVGAIHVRRVLLLAFVAATLIWFVNGYLSKAQPVGLVGTLLALIAVTLTAILLRKPTPRCPRCAHRLTLGRGVESCPTCDISFNAKVQRDWRGLPTTQSPWVTRPETLRRG